jgi:AcrR family transcriptional regulator
MADQTDTEQKIFEAAKQVFLEQGTAKARMQEIADEAGINKAMVHYYFRSKDRLSEAVFQEAAGRFLPRIFGVLAGAQSLEEKVKTVIQEYTDFLGDNPHLPGFVIHEISHHPERAKQFVRSIGTPDLEPLREQLEEQVEAGAIRPISIEQFVVNLIALCVFPFVARPMLELLLGFDGDQFDGFIEQRQHELPAFFLNALRP